MCLELYNAFSKVIKKYGPGLDEAGAAGAVFYYEVEEYINLNRDTLKSIIEHMPRIYSIGDTHFYYSTRYLICA